MLVLFEQDKKVNSNLKSFFLPKSIVETRRQDKDMYHDFINYFVKPVVGKRKFDDSSVKFLLSRYVTVSDEAFALLTFENNYDRWLDMSIRNNWATSDVKPLYSTGGNGNQTPSNTQANQESKKGNNSSTSMYQGWSVQGIRRFNNLYDLIMRERNTEAGRLFEEEFLQYMQEKKDKANKKDRKNNVYEICRHDLWIMDDDINDVATTDAVLESGHYKNIIESISAVNKIDDDNLEDKKNEEADNQSNASSEGSKRVVGV